MSIFSIFSLANMVNEDQDTTVYERPRLPLRKIESLKITNYDQDLEPIKQNSKLSSSNSQGTDDIDALFTRLQAASPKLQERLSFKRIIK